MSDLVAFLTARLDEDEAAAKAATAGPWEWDRKNEDEVGWDDYGPNLMSASATWMSPEGRGPYSVTVLSAWGHDAWGVNIEDADATHIARHDPARVLREVEAKRKILADLPAYSKQRRELRDHMYLPENAGYHSGHADGMDDALRFVQRQLAAAWSDHADYDPAWA